MLYATNFTFLMTIPSDYKVFFYLISTNLATLVVMSTTKKIAHSIFFLVVFRFPFFSIQYLFGLKIKERNISKQKVEAGGGKTAAKKN